MELTVVCLTMATIVAMVCASALIWKYAKTMAGVYRDAQTDLVRTMLSERKLDTQHSPVNKLIESVSVHMAQQTDLIDRMGEKLMAFTAEGRDWKERELTLTSLEAQVEASRLSAERAERAAAKVVMAPHEPRVDNDGEARGVGLWTDTQRLD
jgi:uncharacterized coiled-coil protein SlyX